VTNRHHQQIEGRPNPLTVEGEIAMVGDFASGARRARGWRGALAKGLVVFWLAGFAAGLVLMIYSVATH
jgi:hypothetical protein